MLSIVRPKPSVSWAQLLRLATFTALRLHRACINTSDSASADKNAHCLANGCRLNFSRPLSLNSVGDCGRRGRRRGAISSSQWIDA